MNREDEARIRSRGHLSRPLQLLAAVTEVDVDHLIDIYLGQVRTAREPKIYLLSCGNCNYEEVVFERPQQQYRCCCGSEGEIHQLCLSPDARPWLEMVHAP